MKKPTPRQLQVVRKETLTPNMLRITLGGEDMAGFPEGRESANFKLLIPDGSEKPLVRTYTVRNYDPAAGEVDVDFVLHTDHGPASHWAEHAQPGDPIGFAGPGSPKLVDFTADWFLIVGDMSALPAIGANIEQLPEDARGYAVLEITDTEDQQQLPFPKGIEVQWVVSPDPSSCSTALQDAVISLPWLEGRAAVWAAGESGAVKALRRYFKFERDVAKADLYTSGYWQIGLTEDRHQVVKRQESEG
ncbi:MAG: siderophore-interacting protein [Halioglobus sp.]